jgi:hypothetical protein
VAATTNNSGITQRGRARGEPDAGAIMVSG